MSHWIILALIPFALQGMALGVDEFHCHMRRGLLRWERLGHSLDTLSVFVVNAFAFALMFSSEQLFVFIILALFSCLFVTKDEWVHARECNAFEHWLHSVLFVCHPMTFVSTCFFWVARDNPAAIGLESRESSLAAMILGGQVAVLGLFLVYQVTYWNFFRPRVFAASEKSSLRGMQSASADPQ